MVLDLIVLCLGADFCALNILVKFGHLAAHSAYNIFFSISTRLLIYVFHTSVSGVGISF